jgi:hypothetical protein
MSQEEASVQQYNVHVCRHGNLVYLASLKAASTFYRTLLVANDWDIISFDDINWEDDHVFGFMADPVSRYIKAITEDFFNEETVQVIDSVEYLLPDTEFQNILRKILSTHRKQCFVLTHHSLPLSITLGDYVKKVDWIPLSDDIPSAELFTKLCKKYTITLDYHSENVDHHVSNGSKIAIFNELKTLFGEGNYFRDMVLARDIDLYNDVKSKINVNGNNWDEISWLRNQK